MTSMLEAECDSWLNTCSKQWCSTIPGSNVHLTRVNGLRVWTSDESLRDDGGQAPLFADKCKLKAETRKGIVWKSCCPFGIHCIQDRNGGL